MERTAPSRFFSGPSSACLTCARHCPSTSSHSPTTRCRKARHHMLTWHVRGLVVGHTHEDTGLEMQLDRAILGSRSHGSVGMCDSSNCIAAATEVHNSSELQHLTVARDYVRWLQPVGRSLRNGCQTRGGVETAHRFCYTPRALTREHRAAGDSWNAFCAVKAHMHDVQLKELSDSGCPRRYRSDVRADVGLSPQPLRPSGTRHRQ